MIGTVKNWNEEDIKRKLNFISITNSDQIR